MSSRKDERSKKRRESGPTKVRSEPADSSALRRRHVSRSPLRSHYKPKRVLNVRRSPVRKKAALVNELDVLSLTKKEQEGKSGNASRTAPFTGVQHGNMRPRGIGGYRDNMRRGFGGSAGSGFGFRQGNDFRRAPMYPQRRGIGARDAMDHRLAQGRTNRSEYRRTDEERKGKDEDKPVMNLFDPCKVPTGRSYFAHDDRVSKPVRRFGRGSLPLGWRNAPRTGDHSRNRPDGINGNNREREIRPSDGIWKHDLYQSDDEKEAEDGKD